MERTSGILLMIARLRLIVMVPAIGIQWGSVLAVLQDIVRFLWWGSKLVLRMEFLFLRRKEQPFSMLWLGQLVSNETPVFLGLTVAIFLTLFLVVVVTFIRGACGWEIVFRSWWSFKVGKCLYSEEKLTCGVWFGEESVSGWLVLVFFPGHTHLCSASHVVFSGFCARVCSFSSCAGMLVWKEKKATTHSNKIN